MHQIEMFNKFFTNYKIKRHHKKIKFLVFSFLILSVTLFVGKSIFAASIPTASSVAISGRADVGQTLTGTYSYADPDSDAEGISTFRWLRAATATGTYRAISGATTSTYVLTTADLNQYIKFEVVPVSTIAPATGSATLSSSTASVYLLSDDFTGTSLDTTTRWYKYDTSGTNVTQNGSLTVLGNNTWGFNSIFSQQTFDRSLNDLVVETDLTYSDCSLAKGGVFYESGFDLPIGSLFLFRNGSFTQLYRWNASNVNISNGYWTCANGVPVHVKFVVNAVGGASVYLNGQASAGGSLSAVQAPNTWNNQKVSFQQYNAGTTANFDNVTITDTRAAPGAPTSFVTYSQNNQVALSWTAPASIGSSAITDYLIEYKVTADSTWLTFADGVSTSTTATATGLINATGYDFRVGAINAFATGDASATASATPAATVTNQPTSLAAIGQDGQASLSWTAPSDIGGSAITDYTIEYKTGADSYATFSDGVSTVTTTIVTGLTNGLTYIFRVSAINEAGTSSPSITTTGVPISATAVAPTAGSVAISGRADVGQTLIGSYTYIDSNGDSEGVTTFRWLRAATSAGTYRAIAGATTSTYILTASDLNQFIKFEVTPVTIISPTTGSATLSSATAVVYLLSDDFTGTNIDTTTRWSEYDSTGTNVSQNGSLTALGANTWGGNGIFSQAGFDRSLNDLVVETDLTYSDCSLAKGGVYYDDGTSLPIGSLFFFRNDSVTELYRWNNAVAIISTGYWACANGVPVHVKFVINAVGGDSVYLNNQASPGASLSAAQAPNTWNNQKVSFQQYNAGTSANFDNVTITDTRAAPGAPTSFATSSQNNQVALSWTAPASVGSSAITDYFVEYKATASSTWITFNDGVTTGTIATVTGLTNSTSYDFRVGAINAFTTGDATATASATPAATVPNPPTSLIATYGDAQTILGWTSPSDVGLTVTDYVIEYKTGADSYSTFSDGVSTATTTTVTGLINGLTYTFRVSAVNSFGTSTPSGTATAMPITVSAAAPTATAISFSSRYSVAVGETLAGTYTYIDSNNDSEGITTFRWLRSDTAGGTYIAISGATSSTYVATTSDLNKYIKFEVTPVATVVPTAGSATLSSATQVASILGYLNHILSTGQSLSVGLGGTPTLTTVQPYNNVMLSGSSLIPLVESSAETMSSAMGNTLTSLLGAGVGSQIGVTLHGVSATGYLGLKKGTAPYQNGMDQVTNMKAAAVALGTPYKVLGVTVIHGEGDFTGCNATAYQGYLEEWQNDYNTDVKAITNQVENIPLFTDQMHSAMTYDCPSDDMAVAQLAAAEANPGEIVMVTPKYMLNYLGGRNNHLQNTSYRWLGEYYAKVIKKVAFDKQAWVPLSPASIVRSNNVIVAKFNVPSGPLVLDTSLVAQRTNYGFEYADDSSSATISSVELLNSDAVKITLSATPTGTNQYLRYAYTGSNGSGVSNGAQFATAVGGNLRDSDSTASLYGNTLYNWGVTFKKTMSLDSVSPIISSVTTTISSTTATFGWSTNEAASTIVDYGLTNSYGNSTAEADTVTRTTSHAVVLSQLPSCTTYHYRTRSKDLPQNTGSSSDATFTTAGCVASATIQSETDSSITTSTGGSFDLLSAGNGIALTILSGFSTSNANFQIKQFDTSTVIDTIGLPSTYNIVGSHTFDLKAFSGATTTISSFLQPITVDFFYGTDEIVGLIENSLKIYRWDGSVWNQLSNCSVDTVANKVSCQTSNFSIFGLFGQDEVSSPTAVVVNNIQTNQINIVWTDNSNNETAFVVEKSTNGNSFTNVTTTAANVTSATITGLSANTQYWFRVASTDSINTSTYSTTTGGTYTLAVVPSALSAVANSSAAITVSWSGGTASSYNVVKGSDNAITGQSSSYQYTGLSCGTSYTFKVYGVNGDNTVTTDYTTVIASTNGCGSGISGGSSPSVPSATGAVSVTSAQTTSQTITLNLSATNATQVAISEDPGFAGASWDTYTPTKQFILSAGAGEKTIYVKFRSASGGVTATYKVNVTLNPDYVASTVITPAVSTSGEVVTPVVTTVAQFEVSNPDSTVVIYPVKILVYKPNSAVRYTYSYKNETTKSIKVKILRQVEDIEGKVVNKITGFISLTKGKTFKFNASNPLSSKLVDGIYIIKLKIFNFITGKLLDENSFNINIKKPLPPPTITSNNPDSKIIINGLKLDYKPGSNVLYVYSYKNETNETAQIKIIRQITDVNGKVISQATGTRTLSKGQSFKFNTTNVLSRKILVGVYFVEIKILNSKNKVLDENGFNIIVKK